VKRTVIVFASFIYILLTSLAHGQENARIEKDLPGQKEIPAAAYYGVQTARALENF
jgi:aspartate ammonia-lyase